MIDILTKIHDKYTLEFKISYKARRKVKINDFELNTWMFVPNNLDLNAQTYTREDFYKDIRTNIRLITPVFLVRDIVCGDNCPLQNIKSAMQNMASSPTRTHIAEYEYQIKMFSAIYKSAIRDQLLYIFHVALPDDRLSLINHFITDISEILTAYRQLADIIKTHTVTQENMNYFMFGDEFMSNITEKELFGLLAKFESAQNALLKKELSHQIVEFLEKDKAYKIAHNYQLVETESANKNSELVFRLGALKKYVESDLFLNAKKKRDGVIAEQVYYSMAAGLSMVFATGIAFSFQLKYGNFTMPLFVALVVSYMLKDRIKELMRFYFAHKRSSKYFDNKTTISVKNLEIGCTKEGFDFIPESKVPKEVMNKRNRIPLIQADNRYSKEKIILYRKMVKIDRSLLDQSSNYNIDGVVEIIRLNVLNFLKKMDNPEIPLYAFDEDGKITRVMGTKFYYLNMIFQYKEDNDEKLIRYRMAFNREGIKGIYKMD